MTKEGQFEFSNLFNSHLLFGEAQNGSGRLVNPCGAIMVSVNTSSENKYSLYFIISFINSRHLTGCP